MQRIKPNFWDNTDVGDSSPSSYPVYDVTNTKISLFVCYIFGVTMEILFYPRTLQFG